MANFQFVSVQGAGGGPKGPDPKNRVGDQETGTLGISVFSGLHVPGRRGIVVQEQDYLVEIPAGF